MPFSVFPYGSDRSAFEMVQQNALPRGPTSQKRHAGRYCDNHAGGKPITERPIGMGRPTRSRLIVVAMTASQILGFAARGGEALAAEAAPPGQPPVVAGAPADAPPGRGSTIPRPRRLVVDRSRMAHPIRRVRRGRRSLGGRSDRGLQRRELGGALRSAGWLRLHRLSPRWSVRASAHGASMLDNEDAAANCGCPSDGATTQRTFLFAEAGVRYQALLVSWPAPTYLCTGCASPITLSRSQSHWRSPKRTSVTPGDDRRYGVQYSAQSARSTASVAG